MRKSILFLLVIAVSCSETAIYHNDSYSIYPDMVIQGEYTSSVESPYKIVSDFGGESYVWEKKNDHSMFPKLSTTYPVEEAVA